MRKISDNLLQKLLNYLGTRPYVEVQQLIAEILQLEELDAKKDKKA